MSLFQKPSGGAPRTLHTCPLSLTQMEKLRAILLARGWELAPRQYMHFFAQHEGVSVAAYEKGPKIVIQGRNVDDFVQFILEPEILGASVPEESISSENINPKWFTPHIGIDESGKGDFFGPLVIAGAFVDDPIARAWRSAGIQDSKNISSDKRIRELERLILQTPNAATSVVVIGPERYNVLYEKFKNLNRLLAWGHARVIENLLEMRPDCTRALCDQFGDARLVRNALMEKGRGIELEQQTKAESDPAVAAASILARASFINWLEREGKSLGMPLPRGASAAVKASGAGIVQRDGAAALGKVAKLHFKTAAEILSQTSCTQILPEIGKCD